MAIVADIFLAAGAIANPKLERLAKNPQNKLANVTIPKLTHRNYN